MTTEEESSPLKLFVVIVCETIHTVTTPMGRISRLARELQNKTLALIMAGLFTGISGSILRSTSMNTTTNIKVIKHGVYKTLSITLFWYYMVAWNCNNNDE